MVCANVEATSADGTAIPMTVAHRADLPLNGSDPALLSAYGAYGMCMDAGFKPEGLSLLERGWVPNTFIFTVILMRWSLSPKKYLNCDAKTCLNRHAGQVEPLGH